MGFFFYQFVKKKSFPKSNNEFYCWASEIKKKPTPLLLCPFHYGRLWQNKWIWQDFQQPFIVLTSGNVHIIGSGDNRFCQHIVADGTRWFRRGKKKMFLGKMNVGAIGKTKKTQQPRVLLCYIFSKWNNYRQPSGAEGFGFRHLVHIECLAVINDSEERDGEGLQRTT